MFVGAVPVTVVNQLLRVVDFRKWGKVYVCCSGSLRVDRAIKQRFPDLPVHGNDVSLLSCALGALAAGDVFPITFRARAQFVEDLRLNTFRDRVCAVLALTEFARFAGNNTFQRRIFAHYQANFAAMLEASNTKIAQLLGDGFALASFYRGDFREHAQRAIADGGGIAGFMPTYKKGYERLYRFIDESTLWPAPSYAVWDPANLEEWLRSFNDTGAPWCVVTDHQLVDFQPNTEFRSTLNKPVYGYTSAGTASYRRVRVREQSFAYERVDVATLGPRTVVALVPVDSAKMTFLKNIYLSKGIAHVTGIQNWLVLLDGKVAGGIIYTLDRWRRRGYVYLLSDFAVAREARLSKLIALLSCSKESVEAWQRKMVVRITTVYTTAFTDRPVSMKYRGVFKLSARFEGMLNYERVYDGSTAQQLYGQWWERYGSAGTAAAQDAHRAGEAQESEAA
jgi:hypothetical protein